MELTQYIEGYNPVLLKNALFCYRNKVEMINFPIPDDIRIIDIKTDIRSLFKLEKMLNKPFDKITLKDILLCPCIVKTTMVIKNIYFRYFNMDLVNEIYYWSNRSALEIMNKFKCTEVKANSLAKFNFDNSKYLNRYDPEKPTIYVSKNNVDTRPHLSLDFSIGCIKILGTSDDPIKDLELTYEQYKDQLTPNEIYDICINKAEVKDELSKEDLSGNRLNPFLYSKDEETDEKNIVASNPDFEVIKGSDITIDTTDDDEVEDDKKYVIVDGTIKKNAKDTVEALKTTYLRKPMIYTVKNDTLNYESVGFAIGFKNANADDLLAMANGNSLRLIPALQWLYSQTNEEGLRKRIKELTLGVIFN